MVILLSLLLHLANFLLPLSDLWSNLTELLFSIENDYFLYF